MTASSERKWKVKGSSWMLLPVLVVLIGCARVERNEISRHLSPDSVVEAVLVSADVDATTSMAYEIYLVPAGGAVPDSKFVIFKADHVEGFDVRWREPRFLEIAFEEARIHQFRNAWRAREVQGFGYVVESRLVPLVDSTSLSRRDRGLDRWNDPR
jgi:hypothetical protein